MINDTLEELNPKAQGHQLEYMLLIGGVILVVVFIVLALDISDDGFFGCSENPPALLVKRLCSITKCTSITLKNGCVYEDICGDCNGKS